jgi:hypothetical protein
MTIMEKFCEGCQYYKVNWDAQVDAIPLPCKYEHICKKNAEIMEGKHDGK